MSHSIEARRFSQKKPPGKYPSGFFPLICVLMLAMAGFAMLQGLLVLYCTEMVGLHDRTAYLLYGAFTSLIFAFPIASGFITSRLTGYNHGVILGLTLAIAGLYLICFDVAPFLYFGLAVFAVGNSTGIASIYVLLGRLFKKNDYRRDSGFTFAYTLMNIGAFCSLLLSGSIVNNWGYQSAFIIGAIFMLLALLIFLYNSRTFLKIEERKHSETGMTIKHSEHALGILILLITIPIVSELLFYAQKSMYITLAFGMAAIIYLLVIVLKSPCASRKTMLSFILLTSLGIIFWALYFQAPSMLALFISRNVERTLWGFHIPASDFFALNPLFIILLGPLFTWLWLSLQKRAKPLTLGCKFSGGIALMGCAYLLLYISTHYTNAQHLISINWILCCYVLQVMGELCISPIGISMVGRLVPAEYEGQMMGVWLLSSGLGGVLSGYLAITTTNRHHIISPDVTNPIYAHSFFHFGLISLTIALIAFMVGRMVRHLYITAT